MKTSIFYFFQVRPLSFGMLSMYFSQDVCGLPLDLLLLDLGVSLPWFSRLIKRPNHLNLSVCMVSMIGLILINSSYIYRHFVLCLFWLLPLLISGRSSAAVILLFSVFFSIQDSCPYNSISLRMVMCIRSLAFLGTCWSFNRLYIIPTF